MSGIYVVHTPSQIEQASTLVDLLEASLSLDEHAIRCSSLPGYADGPLDAEGLRAAIGDSAAAIALLDPSSLIDPQLMLELGVAFSYGRPLKLLAEDGAEQRLPSALRNNPVVVRRDRGALSAMVEDLAFELGLSPRLGPAARDAIIQLSSYPPPPFAEAAASPEAPPPMSTERPAPPRAEEPVAEPVLAEAPEPLRAPTDADDPEPLWPLPDAVEPEPQWPLTDVDESELLRPLEAVDDYEALESEPPPPPPAPRMPSMQTPQQLAAPLLSEDDAELLGSDILREANPPLAFEAGRAMGECAFHREEDGDPARELDMSFGRMVDALGGSWSRMRGLRDIDVWLGAVDNLLEGLRGQQRALADWYELGFQLATLLGIAEEGLPESPEEYAAYIELWNQAMAQLYRSASELSLSPASVARLQGQLQNLIGPAPQRDYSNFGRAVELLRDQAVRAA
ncbi:MAG: hypothetical protein OEZ06_31365 [Myxococcales bacterium]|nr:hypothetical protein [Myxococcales bacterium]